MLHPRTLLLLAACMLAACGGRRQTRPDDRILCAADLDEDIDELITTAGKHHARGDHVAAGRLYLDAAQRRNEGPAACDPDDTRNICAAWLSAAESGFLGQDRYLMATAIGGFGTCVERHKKSVVPSKRDAITANLIAAACDLEPPFTLPASAQSVGRYLVRANPDQETE